MAFTPTVGGGISDAVDNKKPLREFKITAEDFHVLFLAVYKNHSRAENP